MTGSYASKVGPWHLRVREPTGGQKRPVLLMFHGLTGDENAMWVFTPHVPKDVWVFSLRAPYEASEGGYSWVADPVSGLPGGVDFLPAVEALVDFLALAKVDFPGNFSALHLLGFSQGAALAMSLAYSQPQRIASLAGLSGFFPIGGEALGGRRPLEGMPTFLAHGTRDQTVPVALAREAVARLEASGAQVTYCEDDVGHKLSAACMRALQGFYRRLGL